MTLKANCEQAELKDKFDFVRAFTGLSEELIRETHLDANGRTTSMQRMLIKQSLRYHGTQKLLAQLFGVNPKTISKWRERDAICDKRPGPPKGKSRVVNPIQELYISQYCARNPSTLNEMLAGLQRTIPDLTRSTLHRLLKRRLPEDVLNVSSHLF
jgi:transposase-like protein